MELENSVDPSKTAFLVIDMQNDYCHKEGSLAKQGLDVSGVASMVPHLMHLIDQAEMYHVPVIYVRTIHEKSTDSGSWIHRLRGKSQTDLCRKGTWGSEFYKLVPEEEDIIVTKHRYSAFIHTKLDSVLHTLNVRNLLMAGVSTNVCVESTARDGFMLDYNVVLLSDCTAAFTREAYLMTLTNISQFFGTVAASNEVIDCWATLDKPGMKMTT
ncbi:cysteine hydrolase family protein [Sporolactobacillus pectinivorans]|uniref:cysteine hydrolase family protein n=1 Tax=Sporolactobacillus pectinivorans TaxID=1591408 RepID=UPI000C256460|nr:isochorismatase family cysteine hydrolase [Sporolactobacillus pectinivorans]